MLVSELYCAIFYFFKQKTAYEMRISDWSSDVCSSDLAELDPSPTNGAPYEHESVSESRIFRLFACRGQPAFAAKCLGRGQCEGDRRSRRQGDCDKQLGRRRCAWSGGGEAIPPEPTQMVLGRQGRTCVG